MADLERLDRLSPKQRAVYDLDREGLGPAEIGRRMQLSEFAVRLFLQDIEERLNPPPATDA
jgi:DNA-binding NarL/FixJ family response regulator